MRGRQRAKGSGLAIKHFPKDNGKHYWVASIKSWPCSKARTAHGAKRIAKLNTATLIKTKAIIPAPYQVRGKLQQEYRKTLDSGSSPE